MIKMKNKLNSTWIKQAIPNVYKKIESEQQNT